jgi:hypothetical protein
MEAYHGAGAAMAWIESHQELGRHPKTARAARRLGLSRATVVGHLHYLWWWCLDYASDGDLSGYSAEEIAEAAAWDGDPSAFVSALVEAGFLDRTDGRLVVHDNADYNGKLKRQRDDNRRRQRDFRDRKRDVTVTPPLRNDHVTPLHNTTEQDTLRVNPSSSSSPINGAQPPSPVRAPAMAPTTTTTTPPTTTTNKPAAIGAATLAALALAPAWPKILHDYRGISPQLSESWLVGSLRSGPAIADPGRVLSALERAFDQLDEVARNTAHGPPEHKIRSWPEFGRKRLHAAMEELAHDD